MKVIHLWSIQHSDAWEQLQRKGYLRGSRQHSDSSFAGAYAWMIDQMGKRLPVKRPDRRSLPVWAWYQYDGAERARPDLRHRGLLAKGKAGDRGVLLSLSVSPERVLLSDFSRWHYVLNYQYLPAGSRDERQFNEKVRALETDGPFSFQHPLPTIELQEALAASWERIFDIRSKGVARPAASLNSKSIQAALWEITRDDVVEVTYFRIR